MDYAFRIVVEKVAISSQEVIKRDTITSYDIQCPTSIGKLGLGHTEQIALLEKVQNRLLAEQSLLLAPVLPGCPICGNPPKKNGYKTSNFHAVFSDHTVRIQKHSCSRPGCRWRSCTSPLRIIVSPRKPGKMPPYHPMVRRLFAMIPHQFYYQLVVLGLLWLFVMLHLAWPSRDVTTQTKPAKPITPRRQRSTDPTPFAGLTHTPHCALCEQEDAHPQAPPPVRPDPMPPTHRRPRTVDTWRHLCPLSGCRYRSS